MYLCSPEHDTPAGSTVFWARPKHVMTWCCAGPSQHGPMHRAVPGPHRGQVQFSDRSGSTLLVAFDFSDEDKPTANNTDLLHEFVFTQQTQNKKKNL